VNGPPPTANQSGPAGIPLSDLARAYGGASKVATDDVAAQPPRDPLDGQTRQRAGLVYRDLPLVTIQNAWSVDQARAALVSHMQGQFDTSAQLWESILGDDRVTATLGSRNAGLFGREVRFEAAGDSDAAKACLAAWTKWWPRLAGGAAMVEINTYAVGLGQCPAQVVWDTSGEVWGPYLRPWAPRFTYYDWTIRRHIALSADGPIPIEPGDAKWLLHAPWGQYRGWIRGAIRPVTEPWMLRHFGFRDMARFSEIHGMPTRVGKVPAVSDKDERAAFETAIAGLGSNTSMIIPQGVDGVNGSGYEYGLVEATDRAWESFGAMIEKCDTAIVLSLLFQNLTTEVTGGSYAATSAHMDIRQSGLQFDNDAWRNTLYTQVARPFAWLNFGDPDLAPYTFWDVKPRDEVQGNAKLFQQFGTAIEVLRRGGVEFTDVEELRKFAARLFGLQGLPDFRIKDPVQGGLGGGANASKLPFTDVDPSDVVLVNEARSLNDLPPIEGGDVTIAEYHKDTAEPDAPADEADEDEEDGDEG
jgi:phage gp29-like protein